MCPRTSLDTNIVGSRGTRVCACQCVSACVCLRRRASPQGLRASPQGVSPQTLVRTADACLCVPRVDKLSYCYPVRRGTMHFFAMHSLIVSPYFRSWFSCDRGRRLYSSCCAEAFCFQGSEYSSDASAIHQCAHSMSSVLAPS